jgi:hypothetical protein
VSKAGEAAALRPSWIGFWAGPVLGFAQLLLLFWLLPASCNGRPWLAPAVALLLTLLLAAVTLYAWRRQRRGPHAAEPPRIDGRTRFVELLGVIVPAFFLVAAVWQLAATLIYPPCLR